MREKENREIPKNPSGFLRNLQRIRDACPVVFALDISLKVVCYSTGEGVNSLNVARTMIVNGKIGNDFELKEDVMPLTILFKPHFENQPFLSSLFLIKPYYVFFLLHHRLF